MSLPHPLKYLIFCCSLVVTATTTTAQTRIGIGGGYFTSTISNEALDPNVEFEAGPGSSRWVGGYYLGANLFAPLTAQLSFWSDLQVIQQRSASNGLQGVTVSYFELKPRVQYRVGERVDLGVGPSIGYSPTVDPFSGLRRETNFGVALSAHVELGNFYLQTIYTHGISNTAAFGTTALDANNRRIPVEQRTRSIQVGLGYLWEL